MFHVRTYNKIASRGLNRFPRDQYEVGPEIGNPDARGRMLVGYSKSGWGAFTLLLRHPGVFSRAAAYSDMRGSLATGRVGAVYRRRTTLTTRRTRARSAASS